MTDYNHFEDEQLIEQMNQGSEDKGLIMDYLLEKYKPLVRKISNDYYIIGGEAEDLIQEGMIGLFRAIRDYKPTKNATFRSFAYLCIQNQVQTALSASNRKKHAPLNNYISFTVGNKEEEKDLENQLANEATGSPEELVIAQESLGEFYRELKMQLSSMEQEVLSYYREGRTYTEIAVIMGREPKAIDNALQRIRKKVSLCNLHELGITPSDVS